MDTLFRPSRRTFLVASGAAAAGAALRPAVSRALGANDRLRIAAIGTGGRGGAAARPHAAGRLEPGLSGRAAEDIDAGPTGDHR